VGNSGLEPLPKGPDLQSGCRIRTTFVTQFLYPEMELNHHHLYVRQIRSHYAIGAKCMFLNFPLINIQTKCILYRWVGLNHRHLPYERSALPLSYISILVDIDSSSILGFPPNPSLPLRESNSHRVDQNHVY
jgi:hypothetical protein